MNPHAGMKPTPALAAALRSARDTRALLIGRGALRQVTRLFATHFPGATAVVVADQNTFPLAGAAVLETLRAAGVPVIDPFVFTDPTLVAEFDHVTCLETSLRSHAAIPLAVGSGTINDLVKLAAHRTGRPSYLCVATAASMDRLHRPR